LAHAICKYQKIPLFLQKISPLGGKKLRLATLQRVTYFNNLNMAIYIKPIPTLTGEVAERFERIARENEARRGTVDFSRQREAMQTILKRSRDFKAKHGIS